MRLVVLEEPNMLPGAPQPKIFDLWHNPARPVLTIGRQVGNDIILIDSSVSRQHLEVQIGDDSLLIRDLNSSNGTFINNQLIAPNQYMLLRPGDRLQLGDVILQIESGSPNQKNPYTAGKQNTGPMRTVSASDIYNQGQYQMTAVKEQAFLDERNSPTPASLTEMDDIPASHYNRRDHSDLGIPDPLGLNRRSNYRIRRRGPRAWVFMIIALFIALVMSFLVYLLVNYVNTNNTPKITALPTVPFASAANDDSALGILVAHPSNWLRQEPEPSRVIFSKPDSPTAAFTIERPPSRTITSNSLTPEATIQFYVSSIKKNAKSPRVVQDTMATKLKDNTPAWMAKVVFSASEDNVSVIDYTVTALSFQCNNTLYFVSVGEEGRFYNGVTQQDLEAAIYNVSCR